MKRKAFSECIQDNLLIETGIIDSSLASELLDFANHRLSFWSDIKHLEEKYPSLFIESSYEIIKELSIAILALDGWKATNHECIYAYLKEKKDHLEIDFNFLLELKDTRNSIEYRGAKISSETLKKNKLKIMTTINTLKEQVQVQLEKIIK